MTTRRRCLNVCIASRVPTNVAIGCAAALAGLRVSDALTADLTLH